MEARDTSLSSLKVKVHDSIIKKEVGQNPKTKSQGKNNIKTRLIFAKITSTRLLEKVVMV